MIGKLRGTLSEKTRNLVLLDVAGVGYEVEVPLTTYFQLPDQGEPTTLHTHLVVREDAQLLFGFLTQDQRDLFRVLIKVNGVGPKLGLTIMSGMDASALARCIKNNDIKSLVNLPGVGKKTAERLVIEVRDKLETWVDLESIEAISSRQNVDQLQDAETALINLGYKPQDAARALAQIADQDESVEVLLKHALKTLSA